jgi:hypothetical protein
VASCGADTLAVESREFCGSPFSVVQESKRDCVEARTGHKTTSVKQRSAVVET